MELRPGYKLTDLGVMPIDWEPVRVGTVAKVKGGKRLPMGYALVETATPHPYIRVSDMFPGGVNTSDIRFVPPAAFSAIQNYRIYTEDLFISVAGTLGIVGCVPPELNGANLTENADRLTDISCDRDYLKFWLLSRPIQQAIEAIRTVGAQPKLALGRIAQFGIALPKSASEQRAISAALSDVDGLLGGLDRLITKKRDLKQAAMQQLLTGQTRLPGFTGEWEETALGQLGGIYGGLTGKTKNDFEGGNAAYVTFMNVMSNVVIDCEAFGGVKLRPGESQNAVLRGDLLFNGSSETPEEVAMCAAVLNDVPNLYLNSFCFGFRFFEHVEASALRVKL